MTIMNFIPKESQGSDFVTHKRSHRRKRENDLSIKRERFEQGGKRDAAKNPERNSGRRFKKFNFRFRLKIDGNKFIEELEAEVSKKRVPSYYKGSSRKSDYCYDIGYQKLLPRIIQQIEQYDEKVTKAA